MNADKNCLSFWFGKLLAAGLPVPRTEIVRTECDLIRLLDGKTPDGFADFLGELTAAREKIGGPACFLRTGQTSGKHSWRETCYLPAGHDIAPHVAALVEFSECAGFLGLPWNVWCVREMLPAVPQMTAFRGMPVCREFRFFVRGDGEVVCHHNYWPRESLAEGLRSAPPDFDHRYECLSCLPAGDSLELHSLASRAGLAVGEGAWSADILDTRNGWFMTDMAVAADSFHWPGCEQAAGFRIEAARSP